MKYVALALTLAFGLPASATLAKNKNNLIEGFTFANSRASGALRLKTPRAWVSFTGGFTTDGEGELRLFNRDGALAHTYAVKTANYNPSIELLTIETPSGELYLYSLQDGQLTDFSRAKEARR